jgi:riboflavin synthase
MFTGIVEALGRVQGLGTAGAGVRLAIDVPAAPDWCLALGESVAVNGVCLTVVAADGGMLAFDLAEETRRVTTLGDLAPGDAVNLERPLRLDARLGGHLVLGHVDGVGEIVSREAVGEGVRVELRLPRGLLPLVVSKGSIALDGISLTVNELLDPDRISLFIIPETLRATTWGGKGAGARVNVEADILGKHVARLLQFR